MQPTPRPPRRAAVLARVSPQTRALREVSPAGAARIWPLPRVRHHVARQVVNHAERSTALRAAVRFDAAAHFLPPQ